MAARSEWSPRRPTLHVDPDRFETLELPFSAVKLTISTVEIGIPELEHYDNVVADAPTAQGHGHKPLYFFLELNNGVVYRFYPFRIDRPATITWA